jgi:hypothetical protein
MGCAAISSSVIALLQEQFDVAMVVGALPDCITQMIDAAVAHMREESCIVLHKAQGTGGSRARFRERRAPNATRFVGTTNGKVQEADRVEYRLSDAAECIANVSVTSCCLGAIGAPHAIDGHEQNRPFPGRPGHDPVFVTITDQARSAFDAQSLN